MVRFQVKHNILCINGWVFMGKVVDKLKLFVEIQWLVYFMVLPSFVLVNNYINKFWESTGVCLLSVNLCQ